MATNNAINAPLPISVSNGGTGQSSLTAHGVLVGEGSSNITPIVLTNGQLLIGSTGADPAATTLTAGSGITITNGAGTITLASSGNMTFTTVSGTSQAISVNNGYIANNAALITFTLPATAAAGDEFEIDGLGAGGWTIAQNSGQLIHFGNQTTTTGAGGSLSSTNAFDVVNVRCIVTNTTWTVIGAQGNLTVV